MKKDNLLLVEYKDLNTLHDPAGESLATARERAQRAANLRNKTVVLVKVVEIFIPQVDSQQKTSPE